jgi:hypothetical protein
MIHIKRPNSLVTLLMSTLIYTSNIQCYALDTYAAFTMSAFLTSFLSTKRTVADVRAKAQIMIDEYEQKHAIFSVADIGWAYKVTKCTDQELASMLWWNNILKSTIIGAFTALVYHSIMHPNPSGHSCTHHCHCCYYSRSSESPCSSSMSEVAAPYRS